MENLPEKSVEELITRLRFLRVNELRDFSPLQKPLFFLVFFNRDTRVDLAHPLLYSRLRE
jgi:hypothetical protein